MKIDVVKSHNDDLCKCGHEKKLHAKTLYGDHHPSDVCYGYSKLDQACPCMKFESKN